jgi:hypothetical protein
MICNNKTIFALGFSSIYENGVSDSEYAPASKRYMGYSSSSAHSLLSSHPHPLMLHPGTGGHSSEMGGRSSVLGTTQTPSSSHLNPFLVAGSSIQGGSSNADESRTRCGDDEWKNIHVVCCCLLHNYFHNIGKVVP